MDTPLITFNPRVLFFLLNYLTISLEAQAFSSHFGVPAQSVAQKTKSKNITKYVTLEYILFCYCQRNGAET